MPLSGATKRLEGDDATLLSAFTFRELLTHKRLAERALRRGKGSASEALIDRINRELEDRRQRKLDRSPPPVF